MSNRGFPKRARARARGGRWHVICGERLEDEIARRATEQDRLRTEVIRRY